MQGREAGERAGGADREDEGERAARGGLRAGQALHRLRDQEAHRLRREEEHHW